MSERRIDTVRIELEGQVVELPSSRRDALVHELRRRESSSGIVTVFENAGTSSSVRLTRDERLEVLKAINQWSVEVTGGLDALGGGIAKLREALLTDLHDTREP